MESSIVAVMEAEVVDCEVMPPATTESKDERDNRILYSYLIEGKKVTVIAKEVGLTHQRVSKIVERAQENPNIRALMSQEWRKRMTSLLMRKAGECLSDLEPTEIAHDKRYLTIGTLIDKVQVLSGEPTEIIEHRGLEGNKILQIFQGS